MRRVFSTNSTRAKASGGPEQRCRRPSTNAFGKSVPGGTANTRGRVPDSNISQQTLGQRDAFGAAYVTPASGVFDRKKPTLIKHLVPEQVE